MKTRAMWRGVDQHSGEHRPPSAFFRSLTGADEHIAELAGLRVRVEAVRALHECETTLCINCTEPWPCSTIKALDGES